MKERSKQLVIEALERELADTRSGAVTAGALLRQRGFADEKQRPSSGKTLDQLFHEYKARIAELEIALREVRGL